MPQMALLSPMRKHPHVRGEDFASSPNEVQQEETPPRAWGRQELQRAELELAGNTPTCVGKTAGGERAAGSRWKHPHVRGEDTERLLTFFIEPSKQY